MTVEPLFKNYFNTMLHLLYFKHFIYSSNLFKYICSANKKSQIMAKYKRKIVFRLHRSSLTPSISYIWSTSILGNKSRTYLHVHLTDNLTSCIGYLGPKDGPSCIGYSLCQIQFKRMSRRQMVFFKLIKLISSIYSLTSMFGRPLSAYNSKFRNLSCPK